MEVKLICNSRDYPNFTFGKLYVGNMYYIPIAPDARLEDHVLLFDDLGKSYKLYTSYNFFYNDFISPKKWRDSQLKLLDI